MYFFGDPDWSKLRPLLMPGFTITGNTDNGKISGAQYPHYSSLPCRDLTKICGQFVAFGLLSVSMSNVGQSVLSVRGMDNLKIVAG